METHELLALVNNEAWHLRHYTTAEEKERLNFETFNPRNGFCCIYGQLDGIDCYGERANLLIEKCAVPFSDSILAFIPPKENPTPVPFHLRSFTAMEFYIAQPGAKNENLINFIKGGKEKLEL